MLDVTHLRQPAKIACSKALDDKILDFDGELPGTALRASCAGIGMGKLCKGRTETTVANQHLRFDDNLFSES
jgi:hypothetical protein